MTVRTRRLAWPLPALLVVLVLAAYRPAWHGGLLWDDDRHVTSADLESADGLRRIWFELGATQQYYPVAHSAFWIQHRLWGDATLGYHIVSAMLHALSACLVLLILRRLNVPGALLAAGIFAVHPVHVESVAWISELKNTLSGVLYLASALSYLAFDERRRRAHYALASALFVLAVLAKTVTATLPAALLVVFWWQRGRIRREDVRPLVPWFAFGIAAGIVTAWVERTVIGAQGAEFELGWIERGLIAGRAIWFYLGKLVWPADLIFNYPRWDVRSDAWWQYLFPLGAAGLIAVSWAMRRRSRVPLAVALLFCGTLFPILGFLNVFPFQYSFVADHFQYLASLPIIASLSAGLVLLGGRLRLPETRATAGLFVIVCLPLAVLSWRQSAHYADAETLYRATLRRNPASWLALTNLGQIRFDKDLGEAVRLFEQALRVKPDLAEAHNNLGRALEKQGRLEDAIPRYEEAVRLKPGLALAHYNLCVAYQQLGRAERAEAACQEAVRLNPVAPEAHNQLGLLRYRQGRLDEAVRLFEQALRVKPDMAEAHNNLGYALQKQGRLEEATPRYEEAVRLKPDLAPALFNLCVAYQQLGRAERAEVACQEAVRRDPASSEAHHQLGLLRYQQGRLEEAAASLTEATRLAPGMALPYNDLGSTLRRLGRLDEALGHYESAARLKPDFADAWFNLGNTLQAMGRQAAAIRPYEQALRYAPSDAVAHNNLGVALEHVGRMDEALAQYREALRLRPEFPEARLGVERIRR